MISYRKGEVILVAFPFSDQNFAKKRPAVIISSETYNANYLDIVIMAITSKVVGESYAITDWKTAGLLYPSAMKPVISTIEQRLVLKRLGVLTSDDLRMIEMVMRDIF